MMIMVMNLLRQMLTNNFFSSLNCRDCEIIELCAIIKSTNTNTNTNTNINTFSCTAVITGNCEMIELSAVINSTDE